MRLPDWLSPWHPANYHGFGKRGGFFEGWYYKLVDASETHVYAVIPGVFLGQDAETSYSFVQTLDGDSGRTTFHRYPLASFSAARREFDVRIGPNRFCADRLILDIQAPDRHLQGELTLAGLAPWPVTLTSPGIMGWYAFVPFMECYHGVLSLDHTIAGKLAIDGETVDFSGGRGYTEKDWGAAFPRAWVWLQSNHFGAAGEPAVGTSLTASVATIPWLGSAFRGFIVGLWHGGQLYRFATYTGARITQLDLSDQQVTWQMAGRAGAGAGRGGYRLEIVATRAEGGLLHGPFRSAMLQRVAESLTATVDVHLWRATAGGEQLVFAGTGRHAGLEINGALHEIQGRRA